MKSSVTYKLFAQLSKDIPNPKTELNYNSTFELLIAVILSAQSTDNRVNIITTRLFKIAGTPEKIVHLGQQKLTQVIKSIGLYKNKAKNIISTCRILLDRHNGEVPKTRKELEALPGVGRKTANVILNTAFGEPVIAVDTHIFRVSNRTGLAKGKTVERVEELLAKKVPKKFLMQAHHLLILHGRYVCKARKPDCISCSIKEFCKFKPKPVALVR